MYDNMKKIMFDSINSTPDWKNILNTFPALNNLSFCMQDKEHHAEGDVWTHTKMVVEELLNLSDFQQLNEEEKFICFYACLFHDMSKPLCTKEEIVNGKKKITSKGHSKLGEIDSRILLWKNEVPFNIREKISMIIKSHQIPFFLIDKYKNYDFMVNMISQETSNKLLSIVAKADIKGRIIEDKNDINKVLENINLFNEISIDNNCFDKPKEFINQYTKFQYFQKQGTILTDQPYYDTHDFNVIVLCGMPASGKNTYVEKYFSNLEVISFDDAKEMFGIKHGQNDGKAVHYMKDKAKELLRKKETFVWNTTNLSKDMRKKTLDLIHNYHGKVELHYLEETENVIKTRNSKRDTTLPNDKIDTMLLKWEPPQTYETFEVKYIINTQKNIKKNNYNKM